MELKKAIEILDYHQEWRLGKRDDMIHEPKQLTKALDIVLSKVKENGLLHDIRLSLPTDSEIEVLADESYKEVIKDFPVYEEYEYTQGYIQGAIVMRNKSEA